MQSKPKTVRLPPAPRPPWWTEKKTMCVLLLNKQPKKNKGKAKRYLDN